MFREKKPLEDIDYEDFFERFSIVDTDISEIAEK